jgi:predicted alpha/beta hydrolase family esterase
MKRVFIVHGWSFNPKSYWIPWLKKELESKGFSVTVPEMPNTDEPEIDAWVNQLSKIVGKPDKDTYFIGHSIGCQTIMRYLEKTNSPVGGAVFVGGWFTLNGLEDEEVEEIAKPWLETPIDYEKVRKNCKITAIFSDNDPFVEINNAELFKKNVDANTILVKKQGHFETQKQIPIILEEFLKLTS